MFDLILFLFATIGLTLIAVEGSIAHEFREKYKDKVFKTRILNFITFGFIPSKLEFQKMISCTQCCGFWSGIFCGMLTIMPDWLIVNKILLYGFASSYICMIGSAILDYYNALVFVDKDE